jgi:hypothetical protein
MNATEMAKSFGKQPIEWLRTKASKEYLDVLTKLRKCSLTDLQLITKGGDKPGTWFIREVAIEFARWLDPGFKTTPQINEESSASWNE